MEEGQSHQDQGDKLGREWNFQFQVLRAVAAAEARNLEYFTLYILIHGPYWQQQQQ